MASRSNTVSRGIPGAGIFGGDQERNATNGTTIECRENAEQAAGIIFLGAKYLFFCLLSFCQNERI